MKGWPEVIWDSGSLGAAELDQSGVVVAVNDTLAEFPGAVSPGEYFASMVSGPQQPAFLAFTSRAELEVWTRARFSMFPGADDIASDHIVWARRTGDGCSVVVEMDRVHEAVEAKLMVLNAELTDAQRVLAREQRRLEELVEELRSSQLYIRKLEGILPICAGCHLVRDDDDQRWLPLADYVRVHSEVRLSHGYCPDCFARAEAMTEAE